MAETKSKGLLGLPHYKNSRASVDKFEPVYQNLFTIEINLPVGLGGDTEQHNLMLENVMKVGGLQTHKMPSAVAEQKYKHATRSFAGALPDSTTVNLSIDFEVNLQPTANGPSAYVLKTLRRWCDLVYDPLTGKSGVKADYSAGWMVVTAFNRKNEPFWQWKFYDVFPTKAINYPDFNYTSNELWKITGFELRADSWDESIV